MQAFNIDTTISAYEAVHGPFNFNKTPMGPPGTRVEILNKNGASWDPKSLSGSYVGPSMHHYCCYDCYYPTTNALLCRCDTIGWIDKNNPLHTDTNAVLRGNQRIEADGNCVEYFPIGTIVRKRIKRKLCGGTVIGFNDKDNFYHVCFDNGDVEELTPAEVKTHRAPYALQNVSKPVPVHIPTPKGAPTHRYPRRSSRSIALGASKYGRYDNRGWFTFVAKQLHTHSAFIGTTIQQTNGYAFNSGKLYDEQLKKFAAGHKLVCHPDAKISRRWRTSC